MKSISKTTAEWLKKRRVDALIYGVYLVFFHRLHRALLKTLFHNKEYLCFSGPTVES